MAKTCDLTQYVVLFLDGFQVYGPFDGRDAANEWKEKQADGDWDGWTVQLLDQAAR